MLLNNIDKECEVTHEDINEKLKVYNELFDYLLTIMLYKKHAEKLTNLAVQVCLKLSVT